MDLWNGYILKEENKYLNVASKSTCDLHACSFSFLGDLELDFHLLDSLQWIKSSLCLRCKSTRKQQKFLIWIVVMHLLIPLGAEWTPVLAPHKCTSIPRGRLLRETNTPPPEWVHTTDNHLTWGPAQEQETVHADLAVARTAGELFPLPPF